MNRVLVLPLLFVCTLRAQVPPGPTSCSLNGLTPFATADCTGWQSSWPMSTPPVLCNGVTVLSIIGHPQLQALFPSSSSTPWPTTWPWTIPGFGFVTGHTDEATGREFAVLNTNVGLVIVDTHIMAATGPTTPPTGTWAWFFPDDPSSASFDPRRGTASFGEFVYESHIVRPTIRIFRITVAPSTGVVTTSAVGEFSIPPSTATIACSYRLTVDRQSGRLFVPTSQGLMIFDVASNPALPVLVKTWPGPCFDVHLQRYGTIQRAFVSDYFNGGRVMTVLRVDDLSNPNWPTEVTSWQAADGGLHSAWMPLDGDFLYSSVGDRVTNVWDMRNNAAGVGFPFGANPLNDEEVESRRLGRVYPHDHGFPGPKHMGMQGIGRTGFASTWEVGLRVYDLRHDSVLDTSVLAQCDTSPCPGSQPSCALPYAGAFACAAYQDSGVVYVSDGDNGLFLMRINVGHVHRFGAGVAENGLVPRITFQSAPPRVPGNASTGPDRVLTGTISNLVPGRVCVVELWSDGAGTGNYAPGFPLWLSGIQFPAVLSTAADANGNATFDLSTVAIPNQFRLFAQAYSYQVNGSTSTLKACSRGTMFGFAGPQ